MFSRKSDLFFFFISISAVVLFVFLVHAAIAQRDALPALREMAAMAERLGLTDLCLFTDARYTRHPSMADPNTPFQDHPLSLEHFPSGSLLSPPRHYGAR
jgi:hypothetical protein